MNQRNTTRTILAVIIATALVVSVGSLTALHTFPADATKPKHNEMMTMVMVTTLAIMLLIRSHSNHN